MPQLPNTVDITSPQGSQWSSTYLLTNSDGTLMNIVGKTFEFSIRRAVTETGTPLLAITQTLTQNGQIIVNTTASTVQVNITATGAATLIHGGGVYTLWMDPNQSDATALVVGTFYAPQVVAP